MCSEWLLPGELNCRLPTPARSLEPGRGTGRQAESGDEVGLGDGGGPRGLAATARGTSAVSHRPSEIRMLLQMRWAPERRDGHVAAHPAVSDWGARSARA